MNFNTSNQTLRQLLGNGLSYQIPLFQRDYSWQQEQWEDLWEDIDVAIKEESTHYMGYLVIQSRDHKNFAVIDGQQRLTTLSLLVLAVLQALQELIDSGADADSNTKRQQQLRNAYIGYLDPVSLIPQSKLKLNSNNDDFYQHYLVPLARLPSLSSVDDANKSLAQAFVWLGKKLKTTYEAQTDGKRLAELVEKLADKLFFTVIVVDDELNAFKVFETLNARGVHLSPTDLLKNYLFSVVHADASASEEDKRALARRWEKMVTAVGGKNLPNFLRVHWNSRKAFVRVAGLFKAVRDHVANRRAVFDLLRAMEQDMEVYLALGAPEAAFWSSEDKQREAVRQLHMFQVRQPWPLLIAARHKLDNKDFTRLLQACCILTFRYNIIGNESPNKQEQLYSRIAQDISNGRLAQARAVITALAPIYLSDAKFKLSFAEKSLHTNNERNRKIARYILFALEAKLSRSKYDRNDASYTLEHILPENKADHWPQFADGAADSYLHRLGNMTLLERKHNSKVANSGFAQKRKSYQASIFQQTQDLARSNSEWTPERLNARQKQMAKQAQAIWRIAQLHGNRAE